MEDLLFGHGAYVAYLAITLFMMSTGAGFPLPEEVFIIAAGVASSVPHTPGGEPLLVWQLALASLLVGALAGDCIMYWVGYHFGRSVVREHRYWAHFVTPAREAAMERTIHKHGLKVLFVARFLVGLRSPVYLTTGILRVPFRRFFLFDLFCATIVIGTFFTLSYNYGEAIYRSIRHVEFIVTAVVVLIVVAVGIHYWRRHRRRKAEAGIAVQKPGDESATGDGPNEKEHVAQGTTDE